MEEVSSTYHEDHPFFSRGCCKSPAIDQEGHYTFRHGCAKLDVTDWMKDIPLPSGQQPFDCIEVRFKNNRKEFFNLSYPMVLHPGDIVAVEASPGHDLGIVTLAGEIVKLQMRKRRIDPQKAELKKIYRKARPVDIEKWISAVGAEYKTMNETREIATSLNLKMKINDVEYQGDGTKAIFYYTADERVDFRELIRKLAERFRIRVEMRQIGMRQEASRLGGVGSCGRELCCSTWLNSFSSVSTNAARTQQLSLNPQKLAGQCSKLKCCLNYEYLAYVDAMKKFPSNQVNLKTKKGEAIFQKSDVFRGLMWYSYLKDTSNLLAIPANRVQQIIDENARGILPEKLEDFAKKKEQKIDFENVVGQDDLTRFDNE
ncbi:MAG: regulatory iron-sulfur-containing complex subunit RicT [Bacteroidales bacterium]|nr:regulatory iron-sulfur-containing complex subunit RicT [Bacteroidales bacterium]MDZ4205077.1 regulatory iron-sulfur-containing complex subunit RicT [Bacteroidales bacterium]